VGLSWSGLFETTFDFGVRFVVEVFFVFAIEGVCYLRCKINGRDWLL
jgi:hypothetical protein